jgi:hypothetical protein
MVKSNVLQVLTALLILIFGIVITIILIVLAQFLLPINIPLGVIAVITLDCLLCFFVLKFMKKCFGDL